MLNNLKIGVRLGIGFAVTLALLIIISTVSYLRLTALNTEVDSLVQDKFPKTVQANDILDAIHTIGRLLRNGYIYTGAEQQKAIEQIPEQRKIISDRIEKLEKTVKSEKGVELMKKMTTARTAYVASMEHFPELLKAGKRDEIVVVMQGDLRKSQTEYIAAINALVDFQTELVEKAGKDADEMANAAERLVLIISAAAVLLALAFAFLITRSITKPVGEALEVTQRLAEGDLTVRIASTSKDEIGNMLSAQQGLIEKLNQIIGEVNTASEALNNAAGQVSQTAQSLSQSSSEQAASVEETTASIEQMTASINQNTENAKVTDGMASKSATEAAEGGTAVKNTVEAMKQIAGKIGIIDDIAYQTNLLALNAAIEAARAGVGQINSAMGQLNQATQQNASASEELAATAEEMGGQSAQLTSLMSFFKIEQGSGAAQSPRPAARATAARGKPTPIAKVGKAKAATNEQDFERF